MTVFPGSLDTSATLQTAVNNCSTTVGTSFTGGDASLILTDATLFPSSGGVIYVDSERGLYTGKSVNTLTGVSGLGNNHSSGVVAALFADAAYINNLNDAVIAVETRVGVTGSTVEGTVATRLSKLDANILTVSSSPTTLSIAQCGLILVDCSAGAVTLNLPTAVGNNGIRYEIKNSVGAYAVTVDAAGTQLIDNDEVWVLAQTEAVIIRSDGTGWKKIAHWVSVESTIGGGGGVDVAFYNATPTITATSAYNAIPINTLSLTPIVTAEQTVSGTAVSNTVAFAAWRSAVLARAEIGAGVWGFDTFCGVDTVAGGRITNLARGAYQVIPGAMTVTTTGSGTSRTCTAASGSPFVVGDASATNTLAGYVQTPQGLYQITAHTSATVVTIATPTGYANESGVAWSKWFRLFVSASPTVTAISPSYTRTEWTFVRDGFAIALTDALGLISYVASNNTTTITVAYNGNSRNTHFHAPLAQYHGSLAGLLDDDHTNYALLAGRSGGQTIIGGTATADDLNLVATSGNAVAGSFINLKTGNNGSITGLSVDSAGVVSLNATPATADSTTKAATTAFVKQETDAFLGIVHAWSKSQSSAASALTSSAASVAVDASLSNVFTHTFTENTTLANPSNLVIGATIVIMFTQHASSPKTLAFGNYWKFPGGTIPTVTASNSAKDMLVGIVRSASLIDVVMNLDIK